MQTLKKRLSLSLIALLLYSLLLGMLLSGCFSKRAYIFGVEDYMRLPKGTILKQVPMTFEGETKLYDVVLEKEGAYFSVDAQKSVFPGTH